MALYCAGRILFVEDVDAEGPQEQAEEDEQRLQHHFCLRWTNSFQLTKSDEAVNKR